MGRGAQGREGSGLAPLVRPPVWQLLTASEAGARRPAGGERGVSGSGDALGRRDGNRRTRGSEGSSAARFFGVASASGRGEGGVSASLHVAPGLGGAGGVLGWASLRGFSPSPSLLDLFTAGPQARAVQ